MSFTNDVINEIREVPLQKTCCRKAFLYGLLINAQLMGGKELCVSLKNEAVADTAVEILQKQFSAEGELSEYKKAGRQLWMLKVKSKALCSYLQELDEGKEEHIFNIVGFKCDECGRAFARGVFIACGTLNDPYKGYHLEFSFLTENSRRIKLFCSFLRWLQIDEPKTVNRGNKTGVYYKKNLAITDLLYVMGAAKTNFNITNIFIERDFRNDENRATNCVTQNIARSVAASIKHIEAIERLDRCGRLQGLGEDICYTAGLRMENPSATLSELALMHEPPISKSGLNRRLTKILEEAELCKT